MTLMKKLFTFALPTLLVAFGVTASATTLVVNSSIFGTTGGGGSFAATLNGTTPVTVFCVDDKDMFNYGTTYTVNVNTFIGSGNIAQTRDNNLTAYEEAGYLTSLYNTSVTGGNDAVQYAIWSLTQTTGTCDSNCVALKNQALANYASFMSNHTITIYTDAQAGCQTLGAGSAAAGTTCMQEFISTAPTSGVPEPSSATLLGLGTGLIGLGALRRRNKATKS
jgi:PEP-CTERM motif